MFTFVLIPSQRPIEELQGSKVGGLQNDYLRESANKYFTDLSEKRGEAIRTAAFSDQLMACGGKKETVEKVMSAFGPMFGTNVEIVTVMVASPANNFTSVSFYCDAVASYDSSTPVNERATKILEACGIAQVVRGDCFVGRCSDDESKDWERLDFSAEEATENAPWIEQARHSVVGKNMNAYSSSGALGNMQSQLKTGVDSEAKEVPEISASYTWSQNVEEVEVKFSLPKETLTKDVSVRFRANSLHVSLKNGPTDDIEPVFQRAEGAQLSGNISTEDSTWTLTNEKNRKILTISLAKIVLSRITSNWEHLLEPSQR